ncbi:Rrf2 family transcriptional regulator [Shimazuella sp. AN120528]|uniref:RrF2 family transcriptional regulator n=1 Tax=Shimazuella soli TaxID=1892854 RepID=UPI001F0D436B|nr:Rrf2 family transcriptional regulator [Shimazuella soli]MCH5585416.1 Rrf2 family transcriptional regulator [Shimazuella soli]
MNFSVGVEYALHCLVNIIPLNRPIGIKDLAEFQGVSESYLSKIFTKLAKARIVQSTPGVKGGYELTKSPKKITFYDVVIAIEGSQPIFQCKNIIAKAFTNEALEAEEDEDEVPCLINRTMLEAEQQMYNFLKEKTLMWLRETLDNELSPDILEKNREWFQKKLVQN